MVEKYPFKIMSAFQDLDLNSISDDNLQEDFTICQFSHHREFICAVREAERIANRSGEKGFYSWRGYRGFVGPNLPPITLAGLKMRLMNALLRVQLSESEKLVKNYIILSAFLFLNIMKKIRIFILFLVCSKMAERERGTKPK